MLYTLTFSNVLLLCTYKIYTVWLKKIEKTSYAYMEIFMTKLNTINIKYYGNKNQFYSIEGAI